MIDFIKRLFTRRKAESVAKQTEVQDTLPITLVNGDVRVLGVRPQFCHLDLLRLAVKITDNGAVRKVLNGEIKAKRAAKVQAHSYAI